MILLQATPKFDGVCSRILGKNETPIILYKSEIGFLSQHNYIAPLKRQK